MYHIYTDGFAHSNPGPGGYGAVVVAPHGARQELAGGFRWTVAGRMEIIAVAIALESLSEPATATLHTNCRHIARAISDDLAIWQADCWQRRCALIPHADQWQRLAEAIQPHQVSAIWCKSHAGISLNERADQLARQAALRANVEVDLAYETVVEDRRRTARQRRTSPPYHSRT
ncbi:MAG: hypothetical protein RLZZ387_1510 [Chloroflexota bacterium]|jgi:ribonuclease HI